MLQVQSFCVEKMVCKLLTCSERKLQQKLVGLAQQLQLGSAAVELLRARERCCKEKFIHGVFFGNGRSGWHWGFFHGWFCKMLFSCRVIGVVTTHGKLAADCGQHWCAQMAQSLKKCRRGGCTIHDDHMRDSEVSVGDVFDVLVGCERMAIQPLNCPPCTLRNGRVGRSKTLMP